MYFSQRAGAAGVALSLGYTRNDWLDWIWRRRREEEKFPPLYLPVSSQPLLSTSPLPLLSTSLCRPNPSSCVYLPYPHSLLPLGSPSRQPSTSLSTRPGCGGCGFILVKNWRCLFTEFCRGFLIGVALFSRAKYFSCHTLILSAAPTSYFQPFVWR